ncbi:unnamed protein product [Rhodiola kirilowii]
MIFGQRKKEMFKAIEERISKRLGDWKSKILSGAGKEVLIKAVLQAIPLYAMSCFKIPISLCRRLTSSILGFWWQTDAQSRGIHWIRLEGLFRDKLHGGLGFREFSLMNKAMLAKQGWRILTEPSLLVSRLLKAKYFPCTDLFNAAIGTRPSYGWRGIREALEIVKQGALWNPSDAKYYWKEEGSGVFTVRTAYKLAVSMEKRRQHGVGEQSNDRQIQVFWKSLWKLKVPPRVKLFGWRLYHNSLPTMRNLLRRGCDVQDRCCFCSSHGEDAVHLFKNCWWIRSLLNGFDLPDAVWNNTCDSPGYWIWLCAKVSSEEQFRTLLCGLWLEWRVRNNIVHGKEDYNIRALQLKLKFLLQEFDANNRNQNLFMGDGLVETSNQIIICDGAFDHEKRRAGFGVAVLVQKKLVAIKAGWEDNISSVFEAECRALRLGMFLANELRLERAVFCSDSREAIWALNLAIWREGVNVQLIGECLDLLDSHQGWELVGIAREQSVVADWLARKARAEQWEWSGGQAFPEGIPDA